MTKTIIPCDDRCMFAQGEECECQCDGINHQQGHRLTATQRTILRTKAGRRVHLPQPRTSEYRWSREMVRMHAEGYTKRDIAKQFGVSAPTVRRAITGYLISKELHYAAKAA